MLCWALRYGCAWTDDGGSRDIVVESARGLNTPLDDSMMESCRITLQGLACEPLAALDIRTRHRRHDSAAIPSQRIDAIATTMKKLV